VSDEERANFKEKLRTLSLVPSPKKTKRTTDVHDEGTVDVIEHADGRVDVTAFPDTQHFKFGLQKAA
jgi:hypothetical protein